MIEGCDCHVLGKLKFPPTGIFTHNSCGWQWLERATATLHISGSSWPSEKLHLAKASNTPPLPPPSNIGNCIVRCHLICLWFRLMQSLVTRQGRITTEEILGEINCVNVCRLVKSREQTNDCIPMEQEMSLTVSLVSYCLAGYRYWLTGYSYCLTD